MEDESGSLEPCCFLFRSQHCSMMLAVKRRGRFGCKRDKRIKLHKARWLAARQSGESKISSMEGDWRYYGVQSYPRGKKGPTLTTRWGWNECNKKSPESLRRCLCQIEVNSYLGIWE